MPGGAADAPGGEGFRACSGRRAWFRNRFLPFTAQSASFVVAIAVYLALAARLPFILRSDFPLNDGGLFVAMTEDVLKAGYALPVSTSYNSENIPFAYPPLAFYLTAGMSDLSGLDLLTLARYVPLAANLATVIGVFFLSRSLGLSRPAQLLAPAVFALLPRGYEWLITGGGLTRSMGLLFAVLCLAGAPSLLAAPTVRRVAWCTLWGAASLATHLETGLFAGYSLFLFLLLGPGRSWKGALALAAVYLGFAGLTTPWWVTVLDRHGLEVFQFASTTAGWGGLHWKAVTRYVFPDEPTLALLGSCVVVGMAVSLVRRRWLLPVWLPAIFLLTPRSAMTEATLPLALLAAVGAVDVLAPGLYWATVREAGVRAQRGWPRLRLPEGAPLMAFAPGLLIGGLLVFLSAPPAHQGQTPLESLPTGERQAMNWVAQHAPSNASFLVVSATYAWEEDQPGEWFPWLAQRRSVLTVQGSEWLDSYLHARRICLFRQLRNSPPSSLEELDRWAGLRGLSFSHVYIAGAPGGADFTLLQQSTAGSSTYTAIFANEAALVLERDEPVAPYWTSFGEPLVARDCRGFWDQPLAVRQLFERAYGGLAAWEWMQQHTSTLAEPVSLLRLASVMPGEWPGWAKTSETGKSTHWR